MCFDDLLFQWIHLGFDYAWTYGGRASVPFPLQGRWGATEVRRSGARGPDLLGSKALLEHQHRELLEEEEVQPGRPVELPQRGAPRKEKSTVPPGDYCWAELRSLEVFDRLPRPRLGSRSWVRTHTRRYIKATVC